MYFSKNIDLIMPYFHRRSLICLILGIVSGIPLTLTGQTLSGMLFHYGINKKTIGIFALVSIPYSIKFLIAPLFDVLSIPFLSKKIGKHRSWLLIIEIMLMISIFGLGINDPISNIKITAIMAICTASFSAAQDILIDSYRIRLFPPEEQGVSASLAVTGYRIGMLISSAMTLLIADQVNWHLSYTIMAMIIPLGLMASMFQPVDEPEKDGKLGIFKSIIQSLASITEHKHWITILLFILSYKLSEAFTGVMFMPFLLEIGFTRTQLAIIVKSFGMLATVIGSIIGGVMVYRTGTYKALIILAILQGATNLFYIVQYKAGADIYVLYITIIIENITGGMGTTAFLAYMSQICSKQYTATQFAIMTSISSIGRTTLSTPGGFIAENAGWVNFFLISILFALPGIILLSLPTTKNRLFKNRTKQ